MPPPPHLSTTTTSNATTTPPFNYNNKQNATTTPPFNNSNKKGHHQPHPWGVRVDPDMRVMAQDQIPSTKFLPTDWADSTLNSPDPGSQPSLNIKHNNTIQPLQTTHRFPRDSTDKLIGIIVLSLLFLKQITLQDAHSKNRIMTNNLLFTLTATLLAVHYSVENGHSFGCSLFCKKWPLFWLCIIL